MSPEDIVFAIEAVRSPVSIYEPAFDDDSSKTLLIDTMAENPEYDMIDTILLKELIHKLDPKERPAYHAALYSDKTQMELRRFLAYHRFRFRDSFRRRLKN
jgi:RNA polymerase sporulation-specific sigma factor